MIRAGHAHLQLLLLVITSLASLQIELCFTLCPSDPDDAYAEELPILTRSSADCFRGLCALYRVCVFAAAAVHVQYD
jgi:hypothetical protein